MTDEHEDLHVETEERVSELLADTFDSADCRAFVLAALLGDMIANGDIGEEALQDVVSVFGTALLLYRAAHVEVAGHA